jgi:hypothetical protein
MKRKTVIDRLGLVIEWAQVGEVIQAPTLTLGEREPYMVLKNCGDLFHQFYCETCGVNLANAGQIEMHVENGGHHRFVIWCSRRSVYEEAKPVELQLEVA